MPSTEPFIQNMEKRIQNAVLLLDASLGHCFVDGLEYRDATAVYDCLCAYAAVDNTRNAEEIFRSIIQKVIPYNSSGMVGGASGDELEKGYKQIEQNIAENCKFVLEISSKENSGRHLFSFLANSILKEVLSAIQAGKPGAFSPRKTYRIPEKLQIKSKFRGSFRRSAVANFRAEAVYVEFMKQRKRSLGVYFSLRFQEIAGALDSALVVSGLVSIQKSDPGRESLPYMALKQSVTLLECLRSCWREDVLVISVSNRFLHLSLQLISRYSNWLSAGLSAWKNHNSGTNPRFEWAHSAVPDDFVYMIHDLDHLARRFLVTTLDMCLSFLIPALEVLDLVKQSILQGGKSLKDLVPSVEFRQLKQNIATHRLPKNSPPERHSDYVSAVLRLLKTFCQGSNHHLF